MFCKTLIKFAGCYNSNGFLFFQEYVATLLKNAFPHLSDGQIKITVQGLFNLNQDIIAFKDHLRDFLVQIRVSIKKTSTLKRISYMHRYILQN